jgi:lysozyme
MMMHISQDGIELIKKFEGFRPSPYFCCAGHLTIGYGHKLKPNEQYEQISEQDAHDLLLKDLEIAAYAVKRNITYRLDQNQFSALVSFTYNVGGSALQRSTLRQKINYGELDNVEREMLKWIYVGPKKSMGLVLRRKAEIGLFYRC